MSDLFEKLAWFQSDVLPVRPLLRRRLLRILPTYIDVDEVVDETMARVYAHEQWRDIRNSATFTFQTARNLMLDQIRRDSVVSFQYMADLEVLGRSVSYDGMLDARDELRRLENIINRLPRQQRRAFVLRRIEGHSLAEVAEIMELSVSTVENHLTKALAAVTREALECEDFGSERPAGDPRGQESDRAGSVSSRNPAQLR